MGERGKRIETIILSVFSILLMVIASIAAFIQFPLVGFDLKMDDLLAREKGLRRELFAGPYNPDIDPRTGVYIQDMAGICQDGRIRSIQFTVGLLKGHPPVNLSRCRFHFMGSFESIYYQFDDPVAMARGEGANYSIIQDPDGLMAMGILTENASVSVTLEGVNDIPGGSFNLYFEPDAGAVEEYQFVIAKFRVDPPYDRGCRNAVRIVDADGSFPLPSQRDRVIGNETRLENMTLTLDGNLTVVDNGSLIIRDSTILVNSSETYHPALTVGARGRMELQNATIRPVNETGHSYWDYRFRITIFGELRMNASSVHSAGFSSFIIYSDDVSVDNCIVDDVGCVGCSPAITNSTLGRMSLCGSSARIMNNTFGTYVFPGNWTVARPSYQGISVSEESTPSIIGNTFTGLEWGIISGKLADPLIAQNRFRDCDKGIWFEGSSWGQVDGNIFENNTEAIHVDYAFSSVIISNNEISARRGIRIDWFNTATITNNIFRNFTEYGFFSNTSFTRQEGNQFHPVANPSGDCFGARIQWFVALELVDGNRQKGLAYSTSKVTVRNNQGSVMKSLKRLPLGGTFYTNAPTLFFALLPEYLATCNGKEIKCNPYETTVEHLGFKGSLRFNANRTSAFFLVLTQKQSPLVNGAFVLLFIAGAAVAVRLVTPAAARWLEARRLRKSNRPPTFSPPVQFSSDMIEWADDK